MKIRYVYHKGKDSWVGRGIVIWTWILALVRFDWKSLKFNFSHVEIWFPDENGNFGGNWSKYFNEQSLFVGQCFSSTTRGTAEGVRFAPASEVLHHPERWMYQEYEVNEYLSDNFPHATQSAIGRKYDFAGLFGFFLPWNTQDEKKWYCSELCAWAAWYLGLLIWRHKRISPRRLAKVLGGELKPLI